MLNIKSRLVRLAGPWGGYRICRGLTYSVPKILMYHRFSESPQTGCVHREVFERQVVYLKNNFNLITMENLVKIYHQRGSFPKNSIVITVDDGYSDFYEIAYPVLKKHSVPATFFITTRFIDGNFWLWPDSVRYILSRSNEIDLQSLQGDLVYAEKSMTDDDRNELWNMMVDFLLSISDDEKKCWISELSNLQNVNLPERPVDIYRAASWSQVKELGRNGIEIGVHTQSHPSLGRLYENQLSNEIIGATEIIHNQTSRKPASFCFPNGQPSDYTESVKKHVKNAGCQSAVTAFYDEALVDDLFELRRFNVSTDWQYFLRAVNGVDALAAKWLKTNNIMTVST